MPQVYGLRMSAALWGNVAIGGRDFNGAGPAKTTRAIGRIWARLNHPFSSSHGSYLLLRIIRI
jgi:hypothetical protein